MAGTSKRNMAQAEHTRVLLAECHTELQLKSLKKILITKQAAPSGDAFLIKIKILIRK